MTGHIDIPCEHREQVRRRVRDLFTWLRSDRDTGAVIDAWGRPVPGLGLAMTPILVLTSLAPGADSIVADAALDEAEKLADSGGDASLITVRVPAPFPLDLYQLSTTFRPSGASPKTIEVNRAELARILERMGGRQEDVFPVLTTGDWQSKPGAPLPSRDEERSRFCADLCRPDRRYRAAGEYIAAYSDLLLALWDGTSQETTAGTSAIVAARRQGLTPDLLTVNSTFTWANTGPVLHLPVARASQPAAASNERARLRGPARRAATNADDEVGGTIGEPCSERLLARAKNVERFHVDESGLKPAQSPEDVLNEMFATRIPALSPDMRERLAPVGGLQIRASALADRLDTKRRWFMRCLCWLVALAAVALHFSAHWHPAGESLHGLREVFLMGAVVLASTGVVLFIRYQRAAIEPRRYDYRALAEGLRVQFYWLAAGIGRAAAANYLQRQRGELAWIRSAIGAVALPYQPWARRFERLPHDAQIHALERVRACWVGQQIGFYQTRTNTAHWYHRLLHALGWGTALAGLVNVLLLFVWRASGAASAPLGLSLIAAVLALELYVALRFWGLRDTPLMVDGRSVPFSRHYSHVEAAGLVLGATLPLPFLVDRWSPPLPPLDDLWIVVLGILLVASAVLVAWAEKNLYAEHARQYETMHGLFKSADGQIARYLGCAAASLKAGDHAEAARNVALTQALLFDLGREALDEHAEWLILHRSRPLEPFMAG